MEMRYHVNQTKNKNHPQVITKIVLSTTRIPKMEKEKKNPTDKIKIIRENANFNGNRTRICSGKDDPSNAMNRYGFTKLKNVYCIVSYVLV